MKQKDGYYAFPETLDPEQAAFEAEGYKFPRESAATRTALKYLGWYKVISEKPSFTKERLGKEYDKIKENAKHATEVALRRQIEKTRDRFIELIDGAKTLGDIEYVRDKFDAESSLKDPERYGPIEVKINDKEAEIKAEIEAERKKRREVREEDEEYRKRELRNTERMMGIDPEKVDRVLDTLRTLNEAREIEESKEYQVWKVLTELGIRN